MPEPRPLRPDKKIILVAENNLDMRVVALRRPSTLAISDERRRRDVRDLRGDSSINPLLNPGAIEARKLKSV